MELNDGIVFILDGIILSVVLAYMQFITGCKPVMRNAILRCYSATWYYLLFALSTAIVNPDSFFLAVITVCIVLSIELTYHLFTDYYHPKLLMNTRAIIDCETSVSEYMRKKGIGFDNYKLTKKRKVFLLLELENVENYKEVFKEITESFYGSAHRNWIHIYVMEAFVFLIFTLFVIVYSIVN